jgi:hypothetical protein
MLPRLTSSKAHRADENGRGADHQIIVSPGEWRKRSFGKSPMTQQIDGSRVAGERSPI